jgi:hypothetical protein
MDRYTPENRYVITYEGLTDDLIGPEVTKGLNDFLGQAEGVETIDRESVPCIWKAVVKNQPPEHQKEQIEKLQSSKAGGELEKGGPSVGVGGSMGVVSNNVNPPPPPSMAMVPNAVNPPPPPNMDMNHALPPDRSYNTGLQQPEQGGQLDIMNSAAFGQPIPQPPVQVWPGTDKSLQNMYLDQNQQQFLQRQQQLQSMPVAGSGGEPFSQQGYPPAQGQIQSQQQPDHMQQFQQQPHQMQPYGQYPDMQQYQQPMQTMQYQQPMQYDQHLPGNLRHRRLDPGHHDSQRKGPNVPRPYTAKQLELMMNMLSELGDRYKDDVRLNNIMKGYYEKVEKARNELAGGQGQEGKPAAPPGGFF